MNLCLFFGIPLGLFLCVVCVTQLLPLLWGGLLAAAAWASLRRSERRPAASREAFRTAAQVPHGLRCLPRRGQWCRCSE